MPLDTFAFTYGTSTPDDNQWAADTYKANVSNTEIAALNDNIWFLTYISTTTMNQSYQDAITDYATREGIDEELCYYHAAEAFDYRKIDGIVRLEAGDRIISPFYDITTNVPTGAIGENHWRLAMADYFGGTWGPIPSFTGMMLDSYGSIISENHRPELWTELQNEGATDYASAAAILEDHHDNFMPWMSTEMENRGYADEFIMSPNVVDKWAADWPSFTTPGYLWHTYEQLSSSTQCGYISGSGERRKRSWDLLKRIYDESVAGTRRHMCHCLTRVTEESAKDQYGRTDEDWFGFVQHLLAAYYLVHHPQNLYGYFEGSWNNYSPRPLYSVSHYHPNADYEMGNPKVHGQTDYWGETGTDRFYVIDDTSDADKTLAREFENGMVVCRWAQASITRVGDDPKTIALPYQCRRLNLDNTVGPPITEVSLGYGQGAILVYELSSIATFDSNIEASNPVGSDSTKLTWNYVS